LLDCTGGCLHREALAVLELHVLRVFTKVNCFAFDYRTIKTLLILAYIFSYVCNLSKKCKYIYKCRRDRSFQDKTQKLSEALDGSFTSQMGKEYLALSLAPSSSTVDLRSCSFQQFVHCLGSTVNTSAWIAVRKQVRGSVYTHSGSAF